LVATASQPVRLNWGDPWSDVDIMTAGRFMAEDGFIATRFTPIVDIKPLDELSFRYVHYPPLAEIINGVVQRITGSDSLTMFRLLFIGFSALSVLFFFKWVKRIWGERVAWVATALFATNSLWLKYADCIHSHPLHLMTGFGALWWLTRWIDEHRRCDLAIFLAWCAAAFMSSYDYYFFLPIMIIATPWLMGHGFRSRLTLRVAVLGGIGCGAGLALKCGLAIWALGWDGFLHDLHFQFMERSTDKLSYKITREFYKILFFRHYRFMSPTFYVVLLASLTSLIPRARKLLGGPAPWVLLVAGLAFIFGMKQLFCEQYHVSLSLLPFFAITGAMLFVRAVEYRVGLVVALTCAIITYVWHLKEVVTFEYAFLDPEQLEPLRAELDRNDQQNGFIYSTLGFTPPFRYSLNKHMITVSWIRPEDLAGFFEQQTRDFGGHDPYIVHYEPIVAAAEDTKMVSIYAGNMRHLRWLIDPWRSRTTRQSKIRERVDKQLEVINAVADKILVSGAFTMYRLRSDKLRDVLYPRPTTVPVKISAESIEMARAAGAEESISAPEKLGDRTVRYSLHNRPYRLTIIAGGGSKVPPKRPALDFELRLPQQGSLAQRVVMTVIPIIEGTTLDVPGEHPQTVALGAPGVPQRVEFVMPPRGATPSIEEVPMRFRVNRVDGAGHGVAIQTIELGVAP
jgi:hypothetical protein